MKFEPDWTSLNRQRPAQWFLDAKFGIYTHWGPYSVPAYGANGSWYPHDMYAGRKPGDFQYADTKEHHARTWGPPSQFGYKDFIPLFTAEKFDADEWADLFRKAGAQYAGPVAEHHDGFSMWPTKLSKWNAAAMGPKRDVVGELETAIRGQGMRFAATFHHSYNWWYFPTHDESVDCSNPEYAGLYSRPHKKGEKPDREYLQTWFAKLVEVVDGYRPDLVWFDFGLGMLPEEYRTRFLAYYYNKQTEWDKELVVTYKPAKAGTDLPPGAGMVDFEMGRLNTMAHHPWLSDSTVDNLEGGGWSYVEGAGYKPVTRLVHNLVDRVSKNGHLLLNVGPMADGTIPAGAQECLLGMGKWLEVNGEAIYGTVPWLQAGTGPTKAEGGGHFSESNDAGYTAEDIRFTTKDDAVYAICLGIPARQVVIDAIPKHMYEAEIGSISLVGTEGELEWSYSGDGLTIGTPDRMPCEHAVTFKIARRPMPA